MNTKILRQIWKLVSELSPKILLDLNDTELVTCLLREMSLRQPLTPDDYHCLKIYLNHRTSLIRDLITVTGY